MSDSWWDRLSSKWWRDDQHVSPNEDVRRWLQTKHDVASRVRPKTIGEFGVRAGYSAYAMLSAAPDASYDGYDVDDVVLFSEPGAIEHARDLLSSFSYTIHIVDTNVLTKIPPFDLLHIDGDHSYDGCMHDLVLADMSGVRWILVDDYGNGETVKSAVDTFVDCEGLGVEVVDDGWIGSALIDMGR